VVADNDETQDRSCANCSAAYFSTATNAAQCTQWSACAPGTYVSNTPDSRTDRVCDNCSPGTFAASANLSSCQPVTACAAGTHQTTAATSTSAAICAGCSAGEYCAGGAAAPVACTGTLVDADSDPTTACSARTDCQPGERLLDDGDATTDRTCSACAAGTTTSSLNETTCVSDSCPAGQYDAIPGAALSCVTWSVCQPGEYVAHDPSATSDRVCTTCPNATTSSSTNSRTCGGCDPHVLLDENESGTGLTALLEAAHMTVSVYHGESDTSGFGSFYSDSYVTNTEAVVGLADALSRGLGVVVSGFANAMLFDQTSATCMAYSYAFPANDAIATVGAESGHPIVAGVSWSAPSVHWIITGPVVNSATIVATWSASHVPAILYRDPGTGSRVAQFTVWGPGTDFPANARGIMWAAHCE
jgi:hypothetical protein